MSKPKIKSNLKCTFHRDYTISYWNIFSQQWERKLVDFVYKDWKLMSSFSEKERERIERICANDSAEFQKGDF